MYDAAQRVGRVGFEVQMLLLAHPRLLEFDKTAKKLGTEFENNAFTGLTAMPERWRWTADPLSKKTYGGLDEPPPPAWKDWFLDRHHDELADAVGYRSCWVYPDNDYVCFQLELVSEPLDDTYDAERFVADARQIYRINLPQLLQQGIAAAYDPQRPQPIKEQVSLEIDDVRWKHRIDPLRKLSWLALGVHLLTRLHERCDHVSPELGELLAALDRDVGQQCRVLYNYNLFSNYRLLLDGYFFGSRDRLDTDTLRRFVGSRALTAALCIEVDNDRASYLVHGEVELSFDEARVIDLEDFDRLRHFGIDSRFLDVYAGRPQAHLHPRRSEDLAFLTRSLAPFIDLPSLQRFFSAAMANEPAPTPSVRIPLCHPRKTLAEGCVYLELRNIHRVRSSASEHYPRRYVRVEGSGTDEIRVASIGHLHRLGGGLATIADIAIGLGAEFAEVIESGEHGIDQRDFEALYRYFEPRVEYRLRTYRRPPWCADRMLAQPSTAEEACGG